MEFRLHHIAIQSRDLDKSLFFFQNILGFPVIKKEVSSKGRRIVWLKAGDGRLELYGGKPSQSLNSKWNENGIGPLSLGFFVPNLDLAVLRLKEQNVVILKEPYEPVKGERAAMITGPDGEEIVLLEKEVG
ncbi:MAG: VOC family protein [Nitrospirae bacterium]|nr:VOC family protein [Nitrospirota bacterium]